MGKGTVGMQGEPTCEEDANRELRAMMFSLLHLPPLPAIVCALEREDNTVLSTDNAESSHSILASLVEWCAIMDNQKLNSERMMAQMALQNMFHDQLRGIDLDGPIESIYNFYCHHTRLWANCYTPLGNKLLFKPIEDIAVNDRVHSSMLSYAKAQYHHFKDGKEELQISDSLGYAEILRECAKWSREWNAQK
jgi:hypothetical protein